MAKAVKIYGDNHYMDGLIEVVRKCGKDQRSLLMSCARLFMENDHHKYAKETYIKMEDIQVSRRITPVT